MRVERLLTFVRAVYFNCFCIITLTLEWIPATHYLGANHWMLWIPSPLATYTP